MASGYLLDTHTFLWLMLGSDALKQETQEQLGAAAARGELSLSAISCWEIAMLASRGRIHLQAPTQVWIERALSAPGLSVIELSPKIAVEAAELPGDFHGDPADRMIVATARLHQRVLVTRDTKILTYAATGYLSALPC
jgi:PIN domain nuclease of toxin-antitoxin system